MRVAILTTKNDNRVTRVAVGFYFQGNTDPCGIDIAQGYYRIYVLVYATHSAPMCIWR